MIILNVCNDTFSEVDVSSYIVDRDTMVGDWSYCCTIAAWSNEINAHREVTFPPGEGQVPLSIFKDEDAEYPSFPTIFYGHRRPSNSEHDVNVHYSDTCKCEL